MHGHLVNFGRSTGERDKHSAWLSFQGKIPATIMLWDSGELEFEAGFMGDDALDINEHHDIGSVHELDELVARLVRIVSQADRA